MVEGLATQATTREETAQCLTLLDKNDRQERRRAGNTVRHYREVKEDAAAGLLVTLLELCSENGDGRRRMEGKAGMGGGVWGGGYGNPLCPSEKGAWGRTEGLLLGREHLSTL